MQSTVLTMICRSLILGSRNFIIMQISLKLSKVYKNLQALTSKTVKFYKKNKSILESMCLETTKVQMNNQKYNDVNMCVSCVACLTFS